MKFAVSVYSPPGYVFTHAFDEMAQTLHMALQAMGHDAVLTQQLQSPQRRTILFGANEFPRFGLSAQALAADTVLYNLEQFDASSQYVNDDYLKLLALFEVWDYSGRNIEWLAERGIRARHVPVGWMPEMTRIPAAAAQDIDVLFYGSMNERRHRVLVQLQQQGFKVAHAYGAYGAKRDALIARAKIVLNIHFYETKIFEVVRVSYLLSNGVCVVSEDGLDPDEAQFAAGLAFAPYDQLVATCVRLLGDAPARASLAAAGRTLMQGRRQDDYLRAVLG